MEDMVALRLIYDDGFAPASFNRSAAVSQITVIEGKYNQP